MSSQAEEDHPSDGNQEYLSTSSETDASTLHSIQIPNDSSHQHQPSLSISQSRPTTSTRQNNNNNNSNNNNNKDQRSHTLSIFENTLHSPTTYLNPRTTISQHEHSNNHLNKRRTFTEKTTGDTIHPSGQGILKRAHSSQQRVQGSILSPARSRTSANSHSPKNEPGLLFPQRQQSWMTKRKNKKLFVSPYFASDDEEVKEAAEALAAGIPDGIPHSPNLENDAESSSSESDVGYQVEIYLNEDSESYPICPLSKKILDGLALELQLTPQEIIDVGAIQTVEELREYFDNLPRHYTVHINIADYSQEGPELTFAPSELVRQDESMAIFRKKSMNEKVKLHRRAKTKYRRPKTDLSQKPEQVPKATWIDLFFDLLFVATLNDFTHDHHITGEAALGRYIAWFIIMWWAWAGQTFWSSRYDMDDLFTKVCVLIASGAVITFGAFSSDHLNRTSKGFIASYMVLKFILAVEYSNVLFWAHKNGSKSAFLPLLSYIGSNLFSILLWGLSLMVHSEAGLNSLWFVSIAVEMACLLYFGGRTSVTFSGSHLPERFAMFTIIVLGENIIGLLGLTSGAVLLKGIHGPFLLLFLLLLITLYGIWWIYFDDFSEDVFHKTTRLSQLWAYLHLPLHICIVLVGTGALDLIKLYKQQNGINRGLLPHVKSISEGFSSREFDIESIDNYIAPTGFEVPMGRRIRATLPGSDMWTTSSTDYSLTKRYFLVCCSLVFFFNSCIKWVNLRRYDKYQRVVYISRFLNSAILLSLLAIPVKKMTPFALLGSMSITCVLQVIVDLAVVYAGSGSSSETQESFTESAISSQNFDGILSPQQSRSTAFASSKEGANSTQNDLEAANRSDIGPCLSNQRNSTDNYTVCTVSASSKIRGSKHPYAPSHTRRLSKQHQQAIRNLNINSNSLGLSGAYGNIIQTLSDIKKREQWIHHEQEGSIPQRQYSLYSDQNEGSPFVPPNLYQILLSRRLGGKDQSNGYSDQYQQIKQYQRYSNHPGYNETERISSADSSRNVHSSRSVQPAMNSSSVPEGTGVGLMHLFDQPTSTTK